MMETIAERMAEDILGCIKAALEAAGRPACCYQWLRRARTTMPPACDGGNAHGSSQGVAWVRIDERRFIESPRASKGFSGGSCGASTIEEWAMEAGVARCAPGDADGLSCDEETRMAIDGAHDDQLLRMAIICCEPLKRYGIKPVRIRTLGPDGGCIGSVMEFTTTIR